MSEIREENKELRQRVAEQNRIVSMPYHKPLGWATEGERNVRFFLFPDGRMVILGSLSDGTVLWYSRTAYAKRSMTTEIVGILIATTKEPNREWHTVSLQDCMSAAGMSYEALHQGLCFWICLKRDCYVDFWQKEHSYDENSAETIVDMLETLVEEAKNRLNKITVTNMVNALKGYCDMLSDRALAKEPNAVCNAYRETSELEKELDRYACIRISEQEELRRLYLQCRKYLDDIYNHYMSVVR